MVNEADPLSGRLAALAEDLRTLAARGLSMEPEALRIIGALVTELAGEAAGLECGTGMNVLAPTNGRPLQRRRPALLLIINNRDHA